VSWAMMDDMMPFEACTLDYFTLPPSYHERHALGSSRTRIGNYYAYASFSGGIV